MTQSFAKNANTSSSPMNSSSAANEASEFSQLLKSHREMLAGLEELEDLGRSNPDQNTATQNRNIVVTPELLERRAARFCLRIVLGVSIIAGSSTCMLSGSPLLFILGLIIQGAMYVHMIELQHSILHMQVFESPKVARIVGFFLGLPMMISFSDFQYRHLRHHKFLGTAQNTETFNYSHSKLNTVSGFLAATFDYSRWKTMRDRLIKAFTGQQITDGENTLIEMRVRHEYQIFGIVLAYVSLLCVLLGSPWPLILWFAPLLAAEPVHFLLELPEHFGLPAHSNTDVFENTRIWGGSWFARWFTHNTNYHLAHHFNQLVPMDKLPELTKQMDPYIPQSSRSESYLGFYIEVLSGKMRPDFLDRS
ncbi:MAG: fatty acid desaturase [Candidatus Obscuribacterales bacterium]|nr:fatty acid desaturase [Candidatus Obscuribacterales bacterium]